MQLALLTAQLCLEQDQLLAWVEGYNICYYLTLDQMPSLCRISDGSATANLPP